ncbi:MAG: hypothetical protein IJ261_02645 [Clostridia bacterium]|nr:hypothetical protein [Clostridia bacterium]
MLYKKNSAPMTGELFRNPTSEYRATPFWAWNCELNRELLDREIGYMQDMGFGGFHMHVRVGMSTEYLSDDFMELISGSVKTAKDKKMLAWLYDEDKWPSGFAGGLVTQKPENREKYLLFTRTGYGAGKASSNDSSANAVREENGYLLARYEVELDSNGCLKNYRRLADNEVSENCWYAYCETQGTSAWFNLQSYVDTLSPAAITDFINTTHERYKECIGDDFGEAVPAIFTDEPQVARKKMFGKAIGDSDAFLPYTTDFADTYREMYGEELFDKLPELFWELPDGKVSVTRYHYHDHVAERFARAFADNIGGWCDKNGIMLTGHMMEEPSLESQNAAVGDCMRSYRGFGLPGIDMLCDSREFTTAKQCQSAVHQYGREGMLSELYCVTGWDFTFRGHKLQGDWQAVLGVTVRVPHLYWVSMKGEAKRDYPACIGHQSPWYKEYPYIEDHFARVNTAMTRGKPVVRVGVIHPIESYWLRYGPREQTAAIREEMNEQFMQLADWLLFNLIDYNYICEANLPAQADGTKVGQMQYDTIIVPNLLTVRSTTLEFLRNFKANGGKVIFAGSLPEYVDAVASDEAKAFAAESTTVGWSKIQLINALDANREIDLRDEKGERSDNHMYQLRQEDGHRWLFVAPINHRDWHYTCWSEDYTLRLKGEYIPELWNTMDGSVSTLAAEYKYGDTFVDFELYPQDSILLKLIPGRSNEKAPARKDDKTVGLLPNKVEIELAEPNVAVLDMPEYRLNGGEWRANEEILRITDALKDELKMENAIAGGAQPWLFGVEEETETVDLRYIVYSDVEVENVSLALEDFDKSSITFNGKAVDMAKTGIYVDDSIETVSLGKLEKGENTIVISRSFGKVSTLEAVYLLGDFGVNLSGRTFCITAPVRELEFGDWTRQGLPFYGGNVTYKCTLNGNGEELSVMIPHFAQPVCTVDVDGVRMGTVALSPYTAPLGKLSEGEHLVEITAYGNRYNTFAALHLADPACAWYGPDAWRRSGTRFSYEYNVKPCGITAAPMLVKFE